MQYYLIAFVPNSNKEGFTLLSPDFPEIVSLGFSPKECMDMATDALRISMEEYIREKKAIPSPCDLETAKVRIAEKLEKAAVVPAGEVTYHYVPASVPDVTLSNICISMTKSTLEEIDYRAKLCGMTRSKFIVAACRAYDTAK